MSDHAVLERDLVDCERARRDALIAGDMDRLAALLTDDLVHVHTTGVVHGKAELLEHAGNILRFIDVRRGPLLIRPLGPDAAVMTGPMTNVVSRRGEDERIEIDAFVTQLWVRRAASWQIASFHAVRVS